MKNKIKWLMAGGISALLGLMVVVEGGDNDRLETNLSRAELIAREIKEAKIGEEIKSLRKSNMDVVKDRGGGLVARIYLNDRYYYDEEEKTHKPIDLTVKKVSALARLNPERKFDEYVDAGNYVATWFEDKPYDYTLIRGNSEISYKALFDMTGITVETVPQTNGIKQTIILEDTAAVKILSWRIKTNANMSLRDGELIFRDGADSESFVFRVPKPTAWDERENPVNIDVTYQDNILTYEIAVTENTKYPVTIDPSTIIKFDPEIEKTGYLRGVSNNYTSARDTTAAYTPTGPNVGIWVGQGETTIYMVDRSSIVFDTSSLDDSAIIDKTEVILVTDTDYTDNEFDMALVAATFSGSWAQDWYNDFVGWTTGSAHTPIYLSNIITSNAVHTAGDTARFTLTQAGLDSINVDAETHFMLISKDDINNSEVSQDTRAQLKFEMSSSYIKIWYHTDPPATMNQSNTTEITLGDYYTQTPTTNNTVYGDERTSVTNLTKSSIDTLGQRKRGSYYDIFRTNFEVYNIPQMSGVTAGTLMVNLVKDMSTTDFDIQLFEGEWEETDSEDTRFWNFDGRQSGTTPFDGTRLNDVWNTSSFALGQLKIPLNADGLAAVLAATQDTLRMVMISSRDSSATAPSGNEYIVLSDSASTLKITYSLSDSVPDNFQVNQISGATDSLVATWTDRCYDETGYRIIEADGGAYVDSVGADIETIRIGGLLPNTSYAWKVQVIGGAYADSVSAADSCYTEATPPSTALSLYYGGSLDNNYMRIVADTTGLQNPGYTEYAIQDSISGKYIDTTAEPETLKTGTGDWMWDTFSDWGGADGDTVVVEIGKKYGFRWKARSGQ